MLASHNFFSAAVGIAIAAAVIRGIARRQSSTIGNFWVDLVRIHLYVLIPACLVYAIFLVSQGIVQNFRPYSTISVVDQSLAASATQPAQQTIAHGPVASQIAIKMLGTNGGGFFNANAAHPFENPTPLSNFIQMLSIFAIPWRAHLLPRTHGPQTDARMGGLGGDVRDVLRRRHGVLGAESAWQPASARRSALTRAQTSMEGKEIRFGVDNSALFATITTDASCGAVNSMHDSYTPLGGLVPMFNMHMGEVVFGGVGAGMYGILIFVVIAIFIAGLMIGRTPEYLGKKIEAYDVKVATFAILGVVDLHARLHRVGGGVDFLGATGLNNGGPHGLSEILYAFTSGAGNNGSAFAGLSANPANGDPHYNVTLAFDMLLGRFFIIVPVLALAGHMAAKKLTPQTTGSFPSPAQRSRSCSSARSSSWAL